jgi:hypothetical protein
MEVFDLIFWQPRVVFRAVALPLNLVLSEISPLIFSDGVFENCLDLKEGVALQIQDWLGWLDASVRNVILQKRIVENVMNSTELWCESQAVSVFANGVCDLEGADPVGPSPPNLGPKVAKKWPSRATPNFGNLLWRP